MGKIFYQPKDGVTADIIPFFAENRFQLFYLHDYRDVENFGEGTPWRLISTDDFVNYIEEGEVVPRGSRQEQDLYVFTGSVFKRGENDYFLFYTGHNPHFKETPQEAIMIARSSDLHHWEKRKELTFFAPEEQYEVNDWRDPFVFYDEAAGVYKMLLAARLREGVKARRGCVALAESKDLLRWEVKKPFWTPDAYYTHECPDLFQMGDLWYLIFSEFTNRCCTRYYCSEACDDKWHIPAESDGQFDGRAFYAAKTASDGEKRYLFGWVPTKVEENDNKPWQWGGTLVTHELRQGKNGALECYMPESVEKAFCRKEYSIEELSLGKAGMWKVESLPQVQSDTYMISLDVQAEDGVSMFAVCLRSSGEEDRRYAYVFDLIRQELRFSPIPEEAWSYANFINVSRRFAVSPGKKYHVDILVDGDVCVLYCNGTALSSRMYLRNHQPPALFSADGRTWFGNLVVKTME